MDFENFKKTYKEFATLRNIANLLHEKIEQNKKKLGLVRSKSYLSNSIKKIIPVSSSTHDPKVEPKEAKAEIFLD